MNLSYNCKACGRPGSVDVPDQHIESEMLQAMVDKWHPMLTCNTCHDAKTLMTESKRDIARICWRLSNIQNPKSEDLANARTALESASKRFVRGVAQWLRCESIAWDYNIVDVLCDTPARYNDVLQGIWKLARAEAARTTQPALMGDES